MNRIFAIVLVLLMSAVFLPAAPPVATQTDWDGFLAQVAQQKLKDRPAWISLRSGERFKTQFIAATQDGVVVSSDRNTSEWSTGKGKSLVPRRVIQGVEFTGKVGRRGMIGGLAGLGLGIALFGAALSGGTGVEGPAVAGLVVFVPAFGLGGYYLGRSKDRPAPAFTFE